MFWLTLFILQGYIDAQQEGFDKFSTSGKELVDGDHYAAEEIKEKLDNLETEKTSLYELWEQRKVTLDQSLELQLFYRDCQNADNQMAKQEVRPCSCPFIESEGGSCQNENALRISDSCT